ncbi:5-methyltetrahydropteroyltriglutamate--homocysteine S-methyltransferase [Dietzia sp.]|uniref:5-methyltetrahydropteroyltriglutamate-- homocysteine S-methyltransferase n=1 Tax=Dietzia sp. TaxID=1871616 RepID=UPI002FD9FEC2
MPGHTDSIAHLDHKRASSVLGFPRIGPRRELKRALESYWHDGSPQAELLAAGRQIQESTWLELRAMGLTQIPGKTFSYYDHILDDALLFGAVPHRFRPLEEELDPLDFYFAMARGKPEYPPLELVKLEGTTYHYRQPEFEDTSVFGLRPDALLEEVERAHALGIEIRPVITGPLSLLLLSKSAETAADSFRPIMLLNKLLDEYEKLLEALARAGVVCVQFDEPAMTMDRSDFEIKRFREAYKRLSAAPLRPRILVTGPYGDFGPALPALASTDVEAVGLDLVRGLHDVEELAAIPGLRRKRVYAGVIDGQNIWRNDKFATLDYLIKLRDKFPDLVVSTSSSLMHVPYDVLQETELHPALDDTLAFAKQKVAEVVSLANALEDGPTKRWRRLPEREGSVRDDVRARVDAARAARHPRMPYAERSELQAERLQLPVLPTSTLGSFPQTPQIRRARKDLGEGRTTYEEYSAYLREEIEKVIRLQEDIGLDVLVHGEVERNDMVQYFAELMEGFAVTTYGWVQSYGSRCVRPPILFGDVSRPRPMTLEWNAYAQTLTDKPVRATLTGPVTMLARSFRREDIAAEDVAYQIALVVRDEIADLENEGMAIVQVDEPSIRELLPRRGADRESYLAWAVDTFKFGTEEARPDTQIHTHMSYSSLQVMKEAIEDLDADVTCIVATRSIDWVLDALEDHTLTRQVAPGVYESRSGFVPDIDLLHRRLRQAVDSLGIERVWAVPDGGLKTRYTWQLEPSLRNLVAAARRLRRRHGGNSSA